MYLRRYISKHYNTNSQIFKSGALDLQTYSKLHSLIYMTIGSLNLFLISSFIANACHCSGRKLQRVV